MQLSQNVGHLPIVFIRFNPDAYTENGLNVTSCFIQNKFGYKEVQTERMATLSQYTL